jgi:hypothetical protein
MTTIKLTTGLTEGGRFEGPALRTHAGQANWAISTEQRCKECMYAIGMSRRKIRCHKAAEFSGGRNKIQFPEDAYARRFYLEKSNNQNRESA